MTVDPSELRAGQRIDLVTDDGVRIENLPISLSGSDAFWGFGGTGGIRITEYGTVLREGVTVTAIRSQPDPELWLDTRGWVWRLGDDGAYRRLNGNGLGEQHLLADLVAGFGPLRRLTPGEPVAVGDL